MALGMKQYPVFWAIAAAMGSPNCVGSAEIGILPHRNELVAKGLAAQLEGIVKDPAPLPS